MTDDDDGVPLTDEELAGAVPDVPELFSGAVSSRLPDGRIIDADMLAGADPEELVGKHVTAQRLGWDDDGDDPDHTSFDETGYDSPDLAGVLSRFEFTLPDGTTGVGWEVGGQPADPRTIRAAE